MNTRHLQGNEMKGKGKKEDRKKIEKGKEKERKREGKGKKVKNRKVLLIKGLGSQSRTFLSLVCYRVLTHKVRICFKMSIKVTFLLVFLVYSKWCRQIHCSISSIKISNSWTDLCEILIWIDEFWSGYYL